MNSPGDINIAWSETDAVYAATRDGYPVLEGLGATPLEAVAALLARLEGQRADSRDRLIAELQADRRGLLDRLKNT